MSDDTTRSGAPQPTAQPPTGAGRAADAPDTRDAPDQPTSNGMSWGYAIKRSVREFIDDGCTDLAAALTYYAILSIFPGLIALVSLPAAFGQGTRTTDELLNIIEDIAPASVAADLEGPIQNLADPPGAGLALIIGLAVALWSASGYVGAFGRAMNTVYGVTEGRPFWKLRPIILGVTLLMMLLILAAMVMLIVSGPLARSIGETIGAGDTAVMVWNIAKWPALLLIVILIVAMLYHLTPNIKKPNFRWLSGGAVIAIVVWAVASAAFGFYVANFGSYNATYGALAGVIVFLLWLWLTNLALLFGAEFDAEAERARELRDGKAAEEDLQLPPRDSKGIDKAEAKHAELVRQGRSLRTQSRMDES